MRSKFRTNIPDVRQVFKSSVPENHDSVSRNPLEASIRLVVQAPSHRMPPSLMMSLAVVVVVQSPFARFRFRLIGTRSDIDADRYAKPCQASSHPVNIPPPGGSFYARDQGLSLSYAAQAHIAASHTTPTQSSEAIRRSRVARRNPWNERRF
jgi:hypothetical protein